MKKIAVLAVALMITVLAWNSKTNAGNGFGEQFAGSFLLHVAHEGFEEFPAIPALARMDRDGGFIASDASDFGGGIDLPYNTPVYGSWERSGNRRVSVRTLYISFEHDGTPIGLVQTTGSFHFDKHLGSGAGDLFIELFDIADDPLAPDAVPMSTLTATATARRITVPDGI